MKTVLAILLLLAGASAAWADTASGPALTSQDTGLRDDALRARIETAEQELKREDWPAALRDWDALARSGVDIAPARLCQMYFDARQGSFDDQRTSDWCRRAAAASDGGGLYRMGMLYLTGLGVPINLDQAQAMCARALSADPNVPANFCLAAIGEQQAHAARATLAGNRVRGTAGTAGGPTGMAAAPAAAEMCDRTFLAIGMAFDAGAAAQWCGIAADEGNATALLRRGMLYLAGIGGQRDLDAAVRDCARADAISQGHVSGAFCVAAVTRLRSATQPAAPGHELAHEQVSGRPLPATLPDPFAVDGLLDQPRRTAGGLDYTCRKIAEWARFEAKGLVILQPKDKLFGKSVLALKPADFDDLNAAALACDQAVPGGADQTGIHQDLGDFRVSLADLRTRQGGLNKELLQARAEARQIAQDQTIQSGSNVIVTATISSPQEQACVAEIRRIWLTSTTAGGQRTQLEISGSQLSDINGNYVVNGQARIAQDTGDWQSPFTCTFLGRSAKVDTSVLRQPASVAQDSN